MATALVIVESPAKANTLKKYLGKGFKVAASIGHVKDLPKKSLGVNLEKDFEPEYEVIQGKKKILSELKKLANSVDEVFLAPDPDREGEAIAWHIYEDLKSKNKKIQRVLFNEITKRAVQEAIQHPLELNKHKYEAQQTRRILDRLVGYKISPILWDKVRRGLSAGRVQSVALRMVVERDHEIAAFKSEEYWTIIATLSYDKTAFDAKLQKIDGKKAEVSNQKEADHILQNLKGATYNVFEVKKQERKKNPVPPFITSKLQQDAARKLGFSTKKTMMLAQRLYEGIEMGSEGATGLITYMRTDSVRLSNDAVSQVRDFITKQYGKDYIPDTPNFYKGKKSAQDAHEAIRPTSTEYPPHKVKRYVERDMFRLYELIWNRFVACQMTPAVYDQTTLLIDAEGSQTKKGQYVFYATGRILKFNGFLAVYQEEIEEKQLQKGEDKEEDRDTSLPNVQEKDILNFEKLTPNQHFTEPPPRYSEASLVKALEENGIGRPSTYASIISAIQNRDYVVKKENRFYPTDLGQLITELLVKSFPKVMDIEFTAQLEEKLDAIEEGKENWVSVLREFYTPFDERLQKAKKEMRNVKTEAAETKHKCDKCGSGMVVKWGRRGKFLACSSYPDCKNTKEIHITDEGEVEIKPQETVDEKCEKCASPMTVKHGRFGRFLACSKYPECKSTKSFSVGVKCPEKECQGDVVEKRSRAKRIFYGCSKYPECKFASWYKPIKKACPDCKATFLVLKITKSRGTEHACLNKECGFKEVIESVSEDVAT
ncbi:MAG: DNA topoisomerase I [Deltaproteobacteria bacterium RIFCSPHIGHO2_02_FULL_40_11]|nr:MAG: DNA topoisomerase I [Deltaproteobacteria bacterium RIFCSPHIGHO2_02_FULL_40_11]